MYLTLASLLAKPLGKVALIALILVGAQLAGFPVIELASDTLASFGVTFDWSALL